MTNQNRTKQVNNRMNSQTTEQCTNDWMNDKQMIERTKECQNKQRLNNTTHKPIKQPIERTNK